MDLSGAQALCIHKMIKVILIYANKHLILATFLVIEPCFERFDNSQKLIVVGLVLYFP